MAIHLSWIYLNVFNHTLQIFILLSIIVCVVVVNFFVFKKMVYNKTHELAVALDESKKIQFKLEESFEQQETLKKEMVTQEKMASLGSMVVGIAHEVNNPLGVALTTITAQEQNLKKIRKAYDDATLSKAQWIDFMNTSENYNRAMIHNIQHAINTLKGFRVIAVNQMIEHKDKIVLLDFLESIKDGLRFELKRKKAQIEIICKEPVVIEGDIGALTQIFTNLILNSTFHGFVDQSTDNIISIKLAIISHHLIIEYKDNGIGIPKDSQDKIFQMFYTTKPKDGGSGLGLHIVRTVLKDRFNGQISYDPTATPGVLFTIEIPLNDES